MDTQEVLLFALWVNGRCNIPCPLASSCNGSVREVALSRSAQYDKHTLHCVLGSVSSNSHNSTFPTSWIICFHSWLKGLNDWLCRWSCWRACRFGSFSIFWINSRTLALCNCFTANVANLKFWSPCPPPPFFHESTHCPCWASYISRCTLRTARSAISCLSGCPDRSRGFISSDRFVWTLSTLCVTSSCPLRWQIGFGINSIENVACWETSLRDCRTISSRSCRATSCGCRSTFEPNSFVQSWYKEIFGGSRGNMHAFFQMRLLQFQSVNFFECNKLEVFLATWFRSNLMEWWSFPKCKININPIYNVWCFSHALCKCCARRCAFKSIFVHLWALFLGSKSKKNTVHLLLEFWPSNINPLLTTEWKLNAHAKWWICWRNPLWNQWSCVLHALEELGNTQLFLNHQCITDISCRACFPTIVRPIRNFWELTLKIILNSPELNCSVFFSLYYSRMSKKMDCFLRNLERRTGRISWFNINPLPSIHQNDARWIINRLVLFFLLLIGLQNPSPSILTLVLQTDLQELQCRCRSNPSQISLIHEKFWPKIECCLHSETKVQFQLRLYHANNCSPLPARVQFSCLPESIFSVVMIHHFLRHCMKLLSNVSNHEILSNFNNVYKSCFHTEFTQFILLWQLFNSFFIFKKEKSLSRGTSVLISLRRIDCLITLSGRHDVLWWDSHSSHISSTVPSRLSWFAETVMRKLISIVSWVAAMWIVNFPCPLLLSLLQNWTSTFGEFYKHLFRDIVPIPCGLSSSIE